MAEAANMQASYRAVLRKTLIKQGVQIFGIMAACHIICFVLSELLLSETVWISIVSTLVVLTMYFFLAWSGGATRGERAVAVTEMTRSQREAYGREPDERQNATLFHPKRAAVASAIAVGLAALCGVAVGLVLHFTIHQGTMAQAIESGFRMMLAPYLGLAALLEDALGKAAIYVLIPLGMMLFPAVEYLGFLSGPKQRAKVHKAIADHAEKVRKRQLREQKEKRAAQRPPKR